MSNKFDNILVGRKPVLESVMNDKSHVESVMVQKGVRGKVISQILDQCRNKNILFKTYDRQILDNLYKGNHQGVIAKISSVPLTSVDQVTENCLASPVQLILVLDKVQDIGNVGALARTMYAVGAGGIIIPKHEGPGLNQGLVKTSAGAIGKIPVAKAVNIANTLEKLAKQGFNLYCATMDGDNVYATELMFPAVLVLGNEEKGVRPRVIQKCDHQISIPLARQFDSLNVAQAGAMIISEFLRTK